MDITYDNVQGASGLITFTDIPNILKIEDKGSGTYATLTLEFTGDLKSQTTNDGQWYITLFGETVSNVVDYNNALGKSFYASSSPVSTASNVARALRDCPVIAANFTVQHVSQEVRLKAREKGYVWTNLTSWYSTSIPSGNMSLSVQDGTPESSLGGSVVSVDISSSGDYITTLEKNFYGGECAFDLSPVLTTFARLGEAVPYTISLGYTKDGEYSSIGSIPINYISVGYMVNQGQKFLDGETFTIAENHSRGAVTGFDNNTVLYVYGNSIPVSFYNGDTGGMTVTTTYRDSAYGSIGETSTTWRSSSSSRKLWDITLPLSQELLRRAFYVDITLGTHTIRYSVIKPLKMTEYSQRILWRNSYGGISFFDFTGQRNESRDVDVTTYQRNIFDYYTSERNELERIYDNEVKYTVTLKSHLIHNDGKYVFNDLMQSSYVWTEVNGEQYAIIVDSVSVDEQNNNNVYQATVKYHYSQEPSIL